MFKESFHLFLVALEEGFAGNSESNLEPTALNKCNQMSLCEENLPLLRQI